MMVISVRFRSSSVKLWLNSMIVSVPSLILTWLTPVKVWDVSVESPMVILLLNVSGAVTSEQISSV